MINGPATVCANRYARASGGPVMKIKFGEIVKIAVIAAIVNVAMSKVGGN